MNIFGLNGLDIIFVLLIAGFGLRGLFHGLIMEVTGIAGLLIGFVAANQFYPQIALRMDFIAEPQWRAIAAYLAVFAAVFIVINLLGRLLRKVAAISLLSWLDALLGAVAGMIIGLLFSALLLVIIQTVSPRAAFLRTSKLVPYVVMFIERGSAVLPNIKQHGLHLKEIFKF